MFGSFNAKFNFGRGAAPVAAPSFPGVTPTTPGASVPVYGSGGASWVSASDNALVNAGYTLLVSTSADDNFTTATMPFNFYIYGVPGSTLYIGSNTYITLTNGSSEYGSLTVGPGTAAPPYPALHLGSSDNSWQRIWAKNNGSNFSVRYEGNGATTGVPGTPGIVYETTFYQSNGTYQYIQIRFGSHTRPTGVFGIGNGTGSYYSNFGTIQPNTDYVIRTDTTGYNPTIYTGIYTP